MSTTTAKNEDTGERRPGEGRTVLQVRGSLKTEPCVCITPLLCKSSLVSAARVSGDHSLEAFVLSVRMQLAD